MPLLDIRESESPYYPTVLNHLSEHNSVHNGGDNEICLTGCVFSIWRVSQIIPSKCTASVPSRLFHLRCFFFFFKIRVASCGFQQPKLNYLKQKQKKTKKDLYWVQQASQNWVIRSGSEVVVAVVPPPTRNTAMLDLDWLILGTPAPPALSGPDDTWTWPLPNSNSRSRSLSEETTQEAGRHFFRVYGVFTRRLIFSPVALRLPWSITETSSEEKRAGNKETGGETWTDHNNWNYYLWANRGII